MSELMKDLKIIWQIARADGGKTHRERLENFYGPQAADYDRYRTKLLPGRQRLMELLRPSAEGKWLDVGAGTGQNLEFMGYENVRKFEQVLLLDMAKPLLALARSRIDRFQLHNTSVVDADFIAEAEPRLPEGTWDLITFSYSLTMIPDWITALERAYRLLKPGGRIAVVDFYVSPKYADEGREQHSWYTRTFWPMWMNRDNLYLSPDHLPYLLKRSNTEFIEERYHSLPLLRSSRIPFYIFVGQRPQAIGAWRFPK